MKAISGFLLVALLTLAACSSPTGPQPVIDANLATDIAAGGDHTCALAADSTAYCWGSNNEGQVGNTTPGAHPFQPTPVAGSLRFAALSAGEGLTCGLGAVGELSCWGLWSQEPTATPQPVGGLRVFRVVTAGYALGCALADGGVAYCWGSNPWAGVGDGTLETRPTPVAVQTDERFTQIGAGGSFASGSFACGLSLDGAVFCWGVDGNGELGDGSHEARTLPGPISDPRSFSSIAVGVTHACALTSGGDAYCWGANWDGEIGDGTHHNWRLTPVRAAEGMAFASLALGGSHSCALTSDGTAYCWGANGSGQLGDGTFEERDTPVPVSTSMRFASLSLGDTHSCGRTREGAIFCWGNDISGQLGDGSGATGWPIPVLVRW